MRHLIHYIWLALLLMSLAACSAVGDLLGWQKTTALRQLDVVVQAGANQNMVTMLDIVFVMDSNSLSLLPQTGPEWFAQKKRLQDRLANKVLVLSLQMDTPDLITAQALPSGYQKALVVYSYANYLEVDGQQVGNLTPYKCARITIDVRQILYGACP